jgi:hypothetical protein
LFRRNNSKPVYIIGFALVALFVHALALPSTVQQTPKGRAAALKTQRLVGRVLASIGSLAYGVGLGPEHVRFIFGIEERGGATVMPVKISYAFFKDEGPPPDSFFDYSKRYELQVIRDPQCDESWESLSYVKNIGQTGKPLPPTYVLRFLDGAPKLELRPQTVLPCYILRPGSYKVVRRGERPQRVAPVKGSHGHGSW